MIKCFTIAYLLSNGAKFNHGKIKEYENKD